MFPRTQFPAALFSVTQLFYESRPSAVYDEVMQLRGWMDHIADDGDLINEAGLHVKGQFHF